MTNPTITLSAFPEYVQEDSGDNLIYTFTRTGPTTSPLTVNYTIGGTAEHGTDYSGIAGVSTTPSPVLLYANNFDAVPEVASGVIASNLSNGSLEQANSFGAWNGQYFANRSADPAAPTVLTLTSLPAHSAIKIGFILGFLESWDSNDGPAIAAPDYIRIAVDGVYLLESLTSNNASGSWQDFGGGTSLAQYVQANTSYEWSDCLVDMGSSTALTFAHSRSSLTLSIEAYGAGWQGGLDEGWGIDALQIIYVPVEPNATVTFAEGSSTASVVISSIADGDVEADESVALTIAAGIGYNIDAASAVTGIISNDDEIIPPLISSVTIVG